MARDTTTAIDRHVAVPYEVKILLIEDHPLIRDGCRRVLEAHRGFVIEEAPSAAAGLALNSALRPDVAIVDVGLPDRNGLETIASMLAVNSLLKVIILSMHSTFGFVDRAFRSGAKGYMSKLDEPATIIGAVEKVLAGETYLGQAVAQTFVAQKMSGRSNPLLALTRREQRIFTQLGKGRSLAEVSADIGLSSKTIANAVTLIKHKLKTPTTAALIMLAVEHAANDG